MLIICNVSAIQGTFNEQIYLSPGRVCQDMGVQEVTHTVWVRANGDFYDQSLQVKCQIWEGGVIVGLSIYVQTHCCSKCSNLKGSKVRVKCLKLVIIFIILMTVIKVSLLG